MNSRVLFGIGAILLPVVVFVVLIRSADAQTFIATYSLDKTASVVGLLVSIVGFLYTLDRVLAAKNAAELAKKAADDMRNKIASYDSVAACERALAMIEEIKERHRKNEWSIALDRYSIVKRFLIEIRDMNPDLPRDSKTKLVSNQNQLTTMQENVERHLAHPDGQVDAAHFNSILAIEKDKLVQVLSVVRRGVERSANNDL